MIAEFYIVAESFANNTSFTTPEIENKVISLAADYIYIRRYRKTNKIFVHPDIYKVNFLTNLSLSDLLFNPQVAKIHLDRDVFNSLQKIVTETLSTPHTSQEVIEVLLPKHNEEQCHGLIAFNQLDGVALEFQIVYHLHGWLNFRRYYLGLYPKNENFYIDECIKYFPQLYFHERNRTSIRTIFKDCPKKIIYHLAALNDKFRESQQAGLNRTQVLVHFSVNNHLDETASLEGDAGRKKAFTFLFRNLESEMEEVCCESHLKLCFSDNSNAYSNERRIYFHEGKYNIEEGKVLVGHIGRHL